MSVRPRILCLDDEQYVLDALQRSLRSAFTVSTTTDPQQALKLLVEDLEDPFAVIVCDMRMPQMSGVSVLEQAQSVAPETIRVLLTGDADVQGALGAINRGHVFRFMLKPCPPEVLKSTIGAAVEQHRLLRAERELLEATLKGCVDALMETLGMAQPAIFSRAGRLRRLAEDLCVRLDVPDAWQIQMAAQMGEIGAITLPPSAIAALESGTPGTDAEAEMLERLPKLADSVLARIPRLEKVREIVRHQLPTDRTPTRALPDDAPLGAKLLQAVREYDSLVWRGTPPDLALATLTSRRSHDPDTLLALAEVAGMRLPNESVKEIPAAELGIGHELAADLHSAKGVLLVSRGQVITERLLIRVRNFEMTTGLHGRILVVDL